jgi:hypothetical protein
MKLAQDRHLVTFIFEFFDFGRDEVERVRCSGKAGLDVSKNVRPLKRLETFTYY